MKEVKDIFKREEISVNKREKEEGYEVMFSEIMKEVKNEARLLKIHCKGL